MIIPLEKLVAFKENRYIFTRSAMMLVNRIGNIDGYPEEDANWKVVPNILKLMLDDKLHYDIEEMES